MYFYAKSIGGCPRNGTFKTCFCLLFLFYFKLYDKTSRKVKWLEHDLKFHVESQNRLINFSARKKDMIFIYKV